MLAPAPTPAAAPRPVEVDLLPGQRVGAAPPPGHDVEAAQVLLAPPQGPVHVRRASHRPSGGREGEHIVLVACWCKIRSQDFFS